jgi:hypothetical protein
VKIELIDSDVDVEVATIKASSGVNGLGFIARIASCASLTFIRKATAPLT